MEALGLFFSVFAAGMLCAGLAFVLSRTIPKLVEANAPHPLVWCPAIVAGVVAAFLVLIGIGLGDLGRLIVLAIYVAILIPLGLLFGRTHAVLLVALNTIIGFLVFSFLFLDAFGEVSTGRQLWAAFRWSFIPGVVMPVIIAAAIREVIRTLRKEESPAMASLRARFGGAPPLTLIACLLAIPWGFFTAVLFADVIYIGHLLYLASILAWIIVALLMDRSRSVSLVALTTTVALLTAFFFPIERWEPFVVHHWGHHHLWKMLGQALVVFALMPVFFTWVVRWFLDLLIHWVRNRRALVAEI